MVWYGNMIGNSSAYTVNIFINPLNWLYCYFFFFCLRCFCFVWLSILNIIFHYPVKRAWNRVEYRLLCLFSIVKIEMQNGYWSSKSAAASGTAIDARDAHDARGGWIWSESCCRKRFMHSQWQLEVEHSFAKAICVIKEDKEPALQLCTLSKLAKLTVVDICMMTSQQWCCQETKEIIWQVGNVGLNPMCFCQERICQWQALMQPGEIGDEKHTSCVAWSGSCVSVATSATNTALSNPSISDTLTPKSPKRDKQIIVSSLDTSK